MNGNVIVTVGRECGSEGRIIGEMLAKEMGVKCYNKELIALAAKESGLCEEIVASMDEKPTNSFLYSLVMDTYASNISSPYLNLPINQKVFLAQFEAIRNLAAKESCVIVGRCADYALEDDKDVFSVFITANLEDKIKYIREQYDVSEVKAKDIIIKNDKKRSNYYNYYSNKKWGDSRSYNLCVNSSILGLEGTVKTILNCLEFKRQQSEVKEASELL